MFSPKYHSFRQVSPYQERELDATLAISHFKEACLPKNHTLAKWGLP